MARVNASLTVVVLTRARLTSLSRALRSLELQRGATFRVLVVVDDFLDTLDALTPRASRGRAVESVRPVLVRRNRGERGGPGRIARLRQFAVNLVTTEWIAFLDDDNTVTSSHFSSLLRLATSASAPAAHSWRSLWRADGEPHPLDGLHPWSHDRRRARRLYRHYARAGIYRLGSNIIRDQVTPFRRDLSMVDMSEWLFRTAFLRQFPFATSYSVRDWCDARSEDSKLLDEIVAAGIPIPSTRRPTLRYLLGGYSNSASAEGGSLAEWSR